MRGVLLAGLLACNAAAQTADCSVEGQVLDAVTNAPIRKALLILVHKIEPPKSLTTTSDASGRFVFRDLPAGSYDLAGGSRGYELLADHTTSRPRRSGTKLSLAPGQRLTGIALRLTPFSAVSGRVIDEDGDPIQDIQMQLWQVTWRSGKRELSPQIVLNRGTTDDHGRYRIFGVLPGEYYLSAFPLHPVQADERYVQVFYPGVLEAAAAGRIVIAPGAELENIDLKLPKIRTVRVRGQILDVSSADAHLIPEDGLLINFSRGIPEASIAPNGRFEFSGVRPGAYNLVIRAGSQPTVWARRPITVGAADIDGLTIRIPPAVSIAGRVRIDGGTEGELPKMRLRVVPAYPNTVMYNDSFVTPAADGTFRFPNLAPDRYKVIAGLPEGLYVQSVRIGDQSLPGQILDLGAAAEIEIILSRNVATVTGTVRLANSDQPAAEAAVVLIPQDAERRADPSAYRSTTTDESGRFTIRNIVPGEYRSLAWEDMEPDRYSYLDPDFIRPIESTGILVNLRGATATVDLSAIPSGKP